jgi:hypothetical protein
MRVVMRGRNLFPNISLDRKNLKRCPSPDRSAAGERSVSAGFGLHNLTKT